MFKKWLIGLILVLILLVSGIVCKNIEDQKQGQWTKGAQDLLEIKKYPKKPLKKKNLFE